MTQEERVSWVSLIVNLLIGGWYFSHVLALPANTDLLGPRMAAFAMALIVSAIIIGIVSEIVIRTAQHSVRRDSSDATPRDERDAMIHLKASRNGYGALTCAIGLVLALITCLEWMQRYAWAQRFQSPRTAQDTVLDVLLSGPLLPAHIVQLLLFALTLGAITVYISRIFYYRRGW